MSRALTEAWGSFGRASLVDIDRPVASHAHPQCHALFKIGGDDSEFEVNGRLYRLAERQGVLVSAWSRHSYPYPHEARGTRVLALYIEPEWLHRFDRAFGSAGRRDFFPQPGVPVHEDVGRTVRELAEEMSFQAQDSARAVHLLQRLMTRIVCQYSRYRELPRGVPGPLGGVADRRLRKALALLAERATEDVPLERIGREVGLSRPHLFALFRAALSITPHGFKNVLRMEQAYRMLLDERLTLADLAPCLGFAAHPHFTRFFRAHHGIAPDEYRRSAWRCG